MRWFRSEGGKLPKNLLAQSFLLGWLVAGFSSSTLATQPNLAGDWPTYGNGPAHTGYFPGTLNGLPFVLKWKKPLPHAVISQAAIVGGRVYVSVGYYYSSISLWAIDANTGLGLWTNALAGSFSISPPSYDSGSVFIQQDTSVNPSYVWNFDAVTGHTNWSPTYVSQGYLHMAPVVGGGMVFVDTGYYHGLTGYDEATGGQQWFVPLYGSEQWSPAYYNGEVYDWSGSFAEYDPYTGTVNWTLTNGLSGAASARTVTVAGGRAYFTSDSSLYSIDLARHTNAWSISGPFGGTPAMANGLVYVHSNAFVNAYTTNGDFVRKYDTGLSYETLLGPLIVTDDVLIVAGSYGVYIFRLADGSVQQVISSYGSGTGFYYSSTVSLASNTLYIASSDQNLYAYGAKPTTPVALTNPAWIGNGTFQFGFTNIPGATFTALASTNVALPLSNWTSLGIVTQFSSGQYQFTDFRTTNNPRRFYRISSP